MIEHFSEQKRMEVFRALVEAQDGGLSVPESYALIAHRYGVTEIELKEIERNGMDEEWPPL